MVRGVEEADRIRNELMQIERAASNAQNEWNKFVTTGDEAFLKATAFDLHSFYTGIENIFYSMILLMIIYLKEKTGIRQSYRR